MTFSRCASGLLLSVFLLHVTSAFANGKADNLKEEYSHNKNQATEHGENYPSDVNLPAIKVYGFDEAARSAQADLASFKSFLVVEPSIEFNKRWYRQIRRDMSDRDEQRIRSSYARVFKKQTIKRLSKITGLPAVDVATETTLVIEPQLSDFRISAPDLSFKPRTRDFVDRVGAARVTYVLKSGSSDTVLAVLSDYKETSPAIGINELKHTNRVQNTRDFQLLFSRWAKRLGDFLTL